jgi:preprotein translocase subunit SecG
MNILFFLVLLIFCAICVGLVYFVLAQEPKQGGLSSSMGGGGNEFFNARGSGGQLVQLTFYTLGLFMALALILSIFRL